ncbi:MAG: minor capsid protein [Mobilitalea sp.]
MILLDEYDIQEAFAAIEEELIKSMMRNMKCHRAEEITEGIEWSMWQSEQLKALKKYNRTVEKVFKKQFGDINSQVDKLIVQARTQGNMDAEIEILEAIKNGFKLSKTLKKSEQKATEFYDRKLNSLIIATKQDLLKAETAMLRMANEQYRKIIFNAQVYANIGAGTYEKAVDMASKDFLEAGINCIEYKNGARVNIASYAKMAIRTASKRAYLTGEGEKRQEWGISTVIMNKRGAACPKCLPFVGRILIDDVWSDGKTADGEYPLMSTAIAKGLYHPNCKDSHTTYFEGITTPPKAMSQADVNRLADKYRQEQKQKYAERMVQKYKRLKEGSLDTENIKKYDVEMQEWSTFRNKLSSGSNVVIPISNKAVDNINMPMIESLVKEDSDKLLLKHKELLKHAKEVNNSKEVALLLDSGMSEITKVIGTDNEIDLNVPGRSSAKYVIHNHPNNKSFSNKDLLWLYNNDNVKYFSIVKNNGQIEMIYKKDDFNKAIFKLEYERVERKFAKDIVNNKEKGYDKVIEHVLNKTKSGLIYTR